MTTIPFDVGPVKSVSSVPERTPSRCALARRSWVKAVKTGHDFGRALGSGCFGAPHRAWRDTCEPNAALSAAHCVKRVGRGGCGSTMGACAAVMAVPMMLGAYANPSAQRLQDQDSGHWQQSIWEPQTRQWPGGRKEKFWVHLPSQTTYLGDDVTLIRLKCCLLACIGQPLIGAVMMGVTLVVQPVRAFALLGVSPTLAVKAMGVALAAPAVYILLELAAIVGVVYPLTGRRLFSELQQWNYWPLAFCFQPLVDVNRAQPSQPRQFDEAGQHHAQQRQDTVLRSVGEQRAKQHGMHHPPYIEPPTQPLNEASGT